MPIGLDFSSFFWYNTHMKNNTIKIEKEGFRNYVAIINAKNFLKNSRFIARWA